MKKLLFIFLIIFSSQSFAKWEHVFTSKNKQLQVFIDFDNLRESNGYIFYWKLNNVTDDDGSFSMSLVSYHQADCHLFKDKALHQKTYTSLNGKGKELSNTSSDEWLYCQPGSMCHIALKNVCK